MQRIGKLGVTDFPRVAIAVAVAALVLGLAGAIAFDRTTYAILICIAAAVPVLVFVALRAPVIFPFGLYAITVPFDPLLKSAGGTGGTITRFVGIATIVAFAVHALRLRRLNAPPSSWYPWAAFFLWGFATLGWSIVPDDTAGTVVLIGNLFAAYTTAAFYPISLRDYSYARRAIVLAGALTAAYGLYAYAAGQRLGNARLALQSGKLEIDPNHYAAFFAIPIAILAGRLFTQASVRERAIAIVLILPMFANILLTGSRGGLIASTIVIAYVGIRARRFLLLAATAVGGLLVSLAVPNVWQRVFDKTQGEASGRDEIWSVGIQAIKHYGVFGSGFGTFPDAYDENIHNAVQHAFAGFHRPAHNVVIQTTVELGVVGLCILLFAWWRSIAQNATIPRSSALFGDRLACEAAMIGIFVSALTIDLLWFKYLWLCLTLIVMLANAVRPRVLLGLPSGGRQRVAMPAAVGRARARP